MSERSYAARRLGERRAVVQQVCAPLEPRAVARRRVNAGRTDGAAAVAGYVGEMTTQLESMARSAGLDLLAYFLAMARAEANAARGGAAVEKC